MLLIDENFLNHLVRVPVGQVIELRLKENPTTGFRWSFATEGKPFCTVVGEAFEPRVGPPGSAGEHMWQIKAESVGSCELKLYYRRPFDPDGAPARFFEVHVQVTE